MCLLWDNGSDIDLKIDFNWCLWQFVTICDSLNQNATVSNMGNKHSWWATCLRPLSFEKHQAKNGIKCLWNVRKRPSSSSSTFILNFEILFFFFGKKTFHWCFYLTFIWHFELLLLLIRQESKKCEVLFWKWKWYFYDKVRVRAAFKLD